MSVQAKGLLITLFGVLFVVPESLFIRLIDANALTTAYWRVTLVGLIICTVLLVRQGRQPFRAFAQTGWTAVIYIFGLGASGVLFVTAVSLTSVANVVFIIASLPVFAMLFSWLFLNERISPRMALTMAAVVPGLGVIAYGSGETEGASLQGDLLALCASASFATALTAARSVPGTSMVPGVGLGYILAGVAILPWAAPMSLMPSEYGLVACYACVIAISSVLLALGPRYITSAEVGILVLLESVLAPLVVWYVIGEFPGVYALIGGAIVVGALFVSNMVVLLRR